ncbi:hypothetical protein Egran_02890 [Elaphomyces granulatus]|uniref:Outer spore wall protein RRT8 n=1 Tax=Elaphomyces granulatus TaxID=519963 RepID=A0A232LZ20_9EURO|nr:hypothetical protein Egran_02890 [Elaphomyces granulatus]
MADRVKAVATEEALHFKELAEEAARSGAYFYPFKGIIYLLCHYNLWQPLFSRIGPTIALGLGVTYVMFFFTYLPQTALLAFTNGPLAPLSAALLVLSESATMIHFLSRYFLLEDSLIDTFDGTLVACGHDALVADGRQLRGGSDRGGHDHSDPIARLGKLLKQPFPPGTINPRAILRSMLYYIPLNFIPIVGTLMYVIAQGKRVGPLVHARYFQLKGWDTKQRDEWVRRNRAAYTSFGVVAFLLELAPFAALVLAHSNTVGAALWASDIQKVEAASTAPNVRSEQAKEAH